MPKLQVVQPKPADPLRRSLDDYAAHIGARGLSPRTSRHYEAVLRGIFLPFLASEGVKTPQAITQKVLDRLSRQLLDDGGARGQLSRHSVNSYLTTIGHYLSWARKDGEITSSAKPQRIKLPVRVL